MWHMPVMAELVKDADYKDAVFHTDLFKSAKQ